MNVVYISRRPWFYCTPPMQHISEAISANHLTDTDKFAKC